MFMVPATAILNTNLTLRVVSTITNYANDSGKLPLTLKIERGGEFVCCASKLDIYKDIGTVEVLYYYYYYIIIIILIL